MKVKVGNIVYDAENEPIMIIFDNYGEKDMIGHMAEEATKFCMCPEGTNIEWIADWMKIPEIKKVVSLEG